MSLRRMWLGSAKGIVGAFNALTNGLTSSMPDAATDDRNVTTSAQRTFALDDTLSSLAVKLGSRGLPTAAFQLARAATVVVVVERPNGVPVATLRLGSLAAGPQHATWRGRIGPRPAPSGRYRMEVVAASSVGTSSLAALFSFRAHTRK